MIPPVIEIVLPKNEMIKADHFPQGIWLEVIKDVVMKNNLPSIIMSRTDSSFLEKTYGA